MKHAMNSVLGQKLYSASFFQFVGALLDSYHLKWYSRLALKDVQGSSIPQPIYGHFQVSIPAVSQATWSIFAESWWVSLPSASPWVCTHISITHQCIKMIEVYLFGIVLGLFVCSNLSIHLYQIDRVLRVVTKRFQQQYA